LQTFKKQKISRRSLTIRILSPKRTESASMWSLPFSAHSQAHFGRLHPLQCSTAEIFWSGHTQGRF